MRILIVAGGTGGHLYPGIAVARALSGHDVGFIVRRGDLGVDILKKEGFSVREIAGQGLPRAFSLRALLFPFNFFRGWWEARHILKTEKVDWVVGMGGYLSVPVIAMARLMGIRTLLHEQNVFPGLANRLLSHWATSVAVSFPDSRTYFHTKNLWVSGLPVRSDIGLMNSQAGRRAFDFDDKRPVFLVFGGSLGAHRLNTMAVEALSLLLKKGLAFEILHVTGSKDFTRVEGLYRDRGISAKVLPYCHTMAEAYAAADAIVCRAGASTIAELLVARRPALLVPYPYASNDHQTFNARVVTRNGLGRMVLDPDLTPTAIADFLTTAVNDQTFKSEFDRACASLPVDSNPQAAAERLAAYLSKPAA